MDPEYTGNERRRVDIEKIQQEARDRAKLELTIEGLQKSMEETNIAIKALTLSNSQHLKTIEEKLERHQIETEQANQAEFRRVREQIANVAVRLEPIEKDYDARMEAKREAEQRTKDAVEHGKKVAIGAIVLGLLGTIGGFVAWLVGAYTSRPGG